MPESPYRFAKVGPWRDSTALPQCEYSRLEVEATFNIVKDISEIEQSKQISTPFTKFSRSSVTGSDPPFVDTDTKRISSTMASAGFRQEPRNAELVLLGRRLLYRTKRIRNRFHNSKSVKLTLRENFFSNQFHFSMC